MEWIAVVAIAALIVWAARRTGRQQYLGSTVVEHDPSVLAGGRQYREVRARCTKEDVLSFATELDNSGKLFVTAAEKGVIGYLTKSNPVSVKIAEGDVVLYSSITACSEKAVRVRIVTGEPGALYKPPGQTRKIYTAPIVGERSYQGAIGRLQEGEYVEFIREPHNPYDPGAVAVTNLDGDTIGYLPSDSWLRRSIVEEGKGWVGQVDFLGGRPKGVRLRVCEDADAKIGERS